MKKIFTDILKINWVVLILSVLFLILLKASYDIGRDAGKKDNQIEQLRK